MRINSLADREGYLGENDKERTNLIVPPSPTCGTH